MSNSTTCANPISFIKVNIPNSATNVRGLHALDINNDNIAEIVACDISSYQCNVFQQKESDWALTDQISLGFRVCWPYSVRFGYVNNDNIMDIIVGCYKYSSLFYVLGTNNVSPPFFQRVASVIDAKPKGDVFFEIVSADFVSPNGQSDLIAAFQGTNTIEIYPSKNTAPFFDVQDSIVVSTTMSEPRALALYDFDGDNALDIVVSATGMISVYLNRNSGQSWKSHIIIQENDLIAVVSVIAFAPNPVIQSSAIAYTLHANDNVSAVFSATNFYQNNNYDEKIVFDANYDGAIRIAQANINNDDRPDLLFVAMHDSLQISYVINENVCGLSSFAPRISFSANSKITDMAVIDFDNDGDDDVFVSGFSGSPTALYINQCNPNRPMGRSSYCPTSSPFVSPSVSPSASPTFSPSIAFLPSQAPSLMVFPSISPSLSPSFFHSVENGSGGGIIMKRGGGISVLAILGVSCASCCILFYCYCIFITLYILKKKRENNKIQKNNGIELHSQLDVPIPEEIEYIHKSLPQNDSSENNNDANIE